MSSPTNSTNGVEVMGKGIINIVATDADGNECLIAGNSVVGRPFRPVGKGDESPCKSTLRVGGCQTVHVREPIREISNMIGLSNTEGGHHVPSMNNGQPSHQVHG